MINFQSDISLPQTTHRQITPGDYLFEVLESGFVNIVRSQPQSSPEVQYTVSGAAKGGRGGAAAPPNVFQSVVLDSFKSDELRRRGVVLYVTMFFEVIKLQTTVSYAIY